MSPEGNHLFSGPTDAATLSFHRFPGQLTANDRAAAALDRCRLRAAREARRGAARTNIIVMVLATRGVVLLSSVAADVDVRVVKRVPIARRALRSCDSSGRRVIDGSDPPTQKIESFFRRTIFA